MYGQHICDDSPNTVPEFLEGHSLAEMFVGWVQVFQLGMGNFFYDVLQIMDYGSSQNSGVSFKCTISLLTVPIVTVSPSFLPSAVAGLSQVWMPCVRVTFYLCCCSLRSLLGDANQAFWVSVSPIEPSLGPAVDKSFMFRKNNAPGWLINMGRKKTGVRAEGFYVCLCLLGWC